MGDVAVVQFNDFHPKRLKTVEPTPLYEGMSGTLVSLRIVSVAIIEVFGDDVVVCTSSSKDC